MKILVVEDNISLGEAIVKALEDVGHEVTFVKCLRDGALAVQDDADKIDLIITDVQLPIFRDTQHPTGSGLAIVRELVRNRDGTNDEVPTPVYVHSSDTHDRGVDIATWLKEKYPTAVFKKKDYNKNLTTQNVLDFVASNKSL